MSAPEPASATGAGVGRDTLRAWLPVALIVALFVALYWPFLVGRAIFYDEQARYSHCMLLPLVSALWIWERWDHLKGLPRVPSMGGMLLLGGSVLLYLYGRLPPPVNFVQHVAMLGTVVGLVWGLLGRRQLAAYAFPVGYLALTMPLPKSWDDRITLPLQDFATNLSEAVFDALGWIVVRQGNVLQLPGLKLLVEDACSGVHSLYALVALSAAWVFFVDRPRWMRVTLILAAIPVAVLANAIRVIGTGVLAYKVDPALARGGSHYAAGLVVFAIGAVILLGLDWCLKPDELEADAA
jgi:exosortase